MTGEDSNFDGVQQGMQEQPLENLGKLMIFAQDEYDAVTCYRLNKLAHRRCIGPAVMLRLATVLTNWWPTAGV